MIVRENERIECAFVVNGERQRILVGPSDYLCDVLRDELGLTGVKVACGMANCGACTVLRDGLPIYSCITLALDCNGSTLTTIEGMSNEHGLHPVQSAFVEHDALQCGFCTPGQILTMSAFLERNSAPTEDDIRRAMSGNLCRCGAYVKILQAGLKAAELMQQSRELVTSTP